MAARLTSSAQLWVWCVIIVYTVILVGLFVFAPLYVGGEALGRAKCNYLYEFLLEWQTAIGALIGFLGLMVIEALRRGAEFRYSQESDRKEKVALVTFLIQESRDRIKKIEIVRRNLQSHKDELKGKNLLELTPSQISNIDISEFRREEFVLGNLHLIGSEFYPYVLRFLQDYSIAYTYQKREFPSGKTELDSIGLDKLIASATRAEISGREMLNVLENSEESLFPLEPD